MRSSRPPDITAVACPELTQGLFEQMLLINLFCHAHLVCYLLICISSGT